VNNLENVTDYLKKLSVECRIKFDYDYFYRTNNFYFGSKVFANGYKFEIGEFKCDKHKNCPYFWTYVYTRKIEKSIIEKEALFKKFEEAIKNGTLEEVISCQRKK